MYIHTRAFKKNKAKSIKKIIHFHEEEHGIHYPIPSQTTYRETPVKRKRIFLSALHYKNKRSSGIKKATATTKRIHRHFYLNAPYFTCPLCNPLLKKLTFQIPLCATYHKNITTTTTKKKKKDFQH